MDGFLSFSLPVKTVSDMSEITGGSGGVKTILLCELLFLFHEENLFPIDDTKLFTNTERRPIQDCLIYVGETDARNRLHLKPRKNDLSSLQTS